MNPAGNAHKLRHVLELAGDRVVYLGAAVPYVAGRVAPTHNESDVGQLLHSISANATDFFTGHMVPVSRQSVISHFDPTQ